MDKQSSKDKQVLVLFLLVCGILGLPLLQPHSPPYAPVYAVERLAHTERWQVVNIPAADCRSRQMDGEGGEMLHQTFHHPDASICFSDLSNWCPLPPEFALFFRCPLPINQSRLEDLMMLPGIGPHRAALLLDERRKKGRLHGAEDLLAVPGIGPATLQRLLPLISFE
ncbi:helix-hairpin-helix domain-containing protein [Desulfobulbus sp.]|uniref:ComEA family DNA-binding protein n=1 Tax=Desulfobulbus sp. TaxID=895 RepID=UPI0028525DAF|nr:helix-hairpin-helix domain-containing protein [Desulfobulbus sp.]